MPETIALSCGKEEGNSYSLPHHILTQSTICPRALINFYAYFRPVSALKFIKVNLEGADSSGAASVSLGAALSFVCPVQADENDENCSFGIPLLGWIPSFSHLS